MQPQKSALGLTTNQQTVLPKSYRDLLLPRTSLTPSESDIDRIESSITQTQKQLNTLSQQLPKDETQQAALQAAIQTAQTRLTQLNANLKTAKENYAQYLKAQSTLSSALSKYNAAVINENNLTLALSQATSNYDAALAALNNQIAITASAKEALDTAKSNLTQATLELTQEREALSLQELLTTNAKSELDAEDSNNQTLTQLYNNASTLHSQAQATLTQADSALTQAQAAHNQAQANLNQAQSNYDNNLIPDPTWTAPTYQKENTRLVPYTELVPTTILVPTTTTRIDTQTIPNILFNSELTNTEGWSGVYAGWQGSNPALINNQITFSYMNQSVSQGLYSGPFQNATLTLSADWINNDLNNGGVDNYSMTVEVKDINQNPVGTATYNSTGSHGWENKSVTLTATGPVSYITVTFTGIDAGFWYGTYGPTFKNPSLSIAHGQEITETTYREETTYEEVTRYREEIYYTTEPVLTEGNIQVKINEGGQATFTAPEGSTFTSSNLRYEAIDRPECGVNIYPNVQGLSQVIIEADNGAWGDPCGGWYKHVIGTISYLGQPTAPLIKNPALIAPLQEAQASFDQTLLDLEQKQATQETAQDDLNSAAELLTNAQSSLDNSDAAFEEANQAYLEAQTQLLTNKSKVAQLEQKVNTAQEDLSSKESTHTSNEQILLTTQQTEQTTLATKTSTETQLSTAKTETIATSAEKVLAETTLTTTEESTATAYQELATLELPDLTPVQQILEIEPAPIPEPEPEEQGSAEIPTVIENLMEVNLAAVDPTELTEAQAEQLVEAALEVFETATEGSAEYDQALDALALAAQQDDIVLDESLAAIPGVGQAAAAVVAIFNLVGNVGADISPKKRKEAQNLVVTTLVVGQIAQAAAIASASASSSFRRK